jgi:hypothetical protein
VKIIRFLYWLVWLVFPLVGLMFIDHSKAATDLLRQIKIRKLRRGTWPPIQFKPDNPKDGPRLWPPPHPGGPKTGEVYDWAAKWVLETGRDPNSINSIREAWAEVPNEFPNYISKEKNVADVQWRNFRTQVKRKLKKWT